MQIVIFLQQLKCEVHMYAIYDMIDMIYEIYIQYMIYDMIQNNLI